MKSLEVSLSGCLSRMTAVAEALRQGLSDLAVAPICDPEAVSAMAAAGEGQNITLGVGGKLDSPAIGLKGRPLELTGQVKRIVSGRFTITGPMQTGVTVDLGRSAVLDCGAMEIIVSEALFATALAQDVDRFAVNNGLKPAAEIAVVAIFAGAGADGDQHFLYGILGE